MSGMDTLVEFLHARLAEDEQVARVATPGPWRWAALGEATTDHIARHDPARVLAEIDAKRRIVDMHSGHHECAAWDRHSTDLTPTDHTDTVLVDRGYTHEDDPTLRLLALPYAAHKDYRAEWAP
jgi:hypothetical protein